MGLDAGAATAVVADSIPVGFLDNHVLRQSPAGDKVGEAR
jgi:hypothetical protein